MYKIKAGQRVAARRLGVVIRPSETPGRKIDVYKHGFKIASIGDTQYQDYLGYVQLEKKGAIAPGTASKRRELYQIRHAGECARVGTPGYYSCKILW